MRKLAAFLLGVTLTGAPTWLQSSQAQQGKPTGPIDPRHTAPPPAQQPTPQEKGVIRAFTDLVLIDAQVIDREGKPVKGLKPVQFTVLEDGKPQKISSFDYYDVERIETAAAEVSRPLVVMLGAASAPERVREAVRDRRLMVLFFDLNSLEPDQLLRATSAAQKYLHQQMTPADLVAVLAFGNRVGVLANFTNEKSTLERAVARLIPGKDSQLAQLAEAAAPAGQEAVAEDTGAAFTSDEAEFNIFNTDRKLAAVEAVANLLREIPGKKSVIHFTGGITQTGEENRSQLRAATDAANRANVSYYTVDSTGLQAAAPGGDAQTGSAAGTAMFSGAAVFRQTQSRQDSRETLTTLAADTGGRTFADSGDFSEVFQQVQADTSGYYLLGYYSTNSARDGRFRRVHVRAELPGTRIRFREGYYAPKDYGLFTAEDRERQLEEAMRAENPRVELPVAIETAHFRLNPNDVSVPIAAKMASSALQWAEKHGRRRVEFDFAAEVREETTGRVAGVLRDTVLVKLDQERFQKVGQRALVYQGGFILPPGNYRLKFLARENETGRVGTFEQRLSLPALAEPRRLELSSVLLSSQLEKVQKSSEVETKAFAADVKLKNSPLELGGERIVPSVTRVFTTEQKLYIFFQAYLPPKDDGSKLRAGLVFFRNGERTNGTPLVEPAEVDQKTGTAAFRISLPLERLAPGRYTVQAIVVDGAADQAAFARSYFALRLPVAAPPASQSAPAKPGH